MPIGDEVDYQGQHYVCVGVNGHTRRNGTSTILEVWRSRCAECGSPFDFKHSIASFGRAPPNRRCKAHARRGVRVNPPAKAMRRGKPTASQNALASAEAVIVAVLGCGEMSLAEIEVDLRMRVMLGDLADIAVQRALGLHLEAWTRYYLSRRLRQLKKRGAVSDRRVEGYTGPAQYHPHKWKVEGATTVRTTVAVAPPVPQKAMPAQSMAAQSMPVKTLPEEAITYASFGGSEAAWEAIFDRMCANMLRVLSRRYDTMQWKLLQEAAAEEAGLDSDAARMARDQDEFNNCVDWLKKEGKLDSSSTKGEPFWLTAFWLTAAGREEAAALP